MKKKKVGWGSGTTKKKAAAAPAPLSVEELLRKKKEADEAASKVRVQNSGVYFALNGWLDANYMVDVNSRNSSPARNEKS